jgi:hypothetical protein
LVREYEHGDDYGLIRGLLNCVLLAAVVVAAAWWLTQ